VNEAAIKHYGYSRAEFLNQITLANIRPVHEQLDMLSLIKKIKHNQTVKKELTHVKKDGSTIYVNITSYSIEYNGALCRMVIINDITQQKLKDIKLTDAMNRITETLESITDGFATLDSKMRVTYWNKEAERILDLTKDTIMNKKLWDLHSYYRELEVFDKFTKSFKHKATIKFEEYIAPLQKWVCFTVYPGGDGLAIYFQDITGQKHGEEQIYLKNQSLNKIAFMNSHMIRKPLANILGIINSLDNLPQSDQLIQPIEMLKQSAIELDDIIKSINSSVENTIK
jgi:PAS domain S-box-containing protein